MRAANGVEVYALLEGGILNHKAEAMTVPFVLSTVILQKLRNR